MSIAHRGHARVARLEQRRLDAAQLFAARARTTDVARLLGVAWRTAHRWRKQLATSGVEGLRSRGRPGRKPLLDVAQRRRLRRLLEAGPRRAGLPADVWTLSRIQSVVERVFGVRCSRVSIWRMVRRWSASASLLGPAGRTGAAVPADEPAPPPAGRQRVDASPV